MSSMGRFAPEQTEVQKIVAVLQRIIFGIATRQADGTRERKLIIIEAHIDDAVPRATEFR
jgi:hypothetical protein